MPSSVDLGPKLEAVVEKLVAKGRYGSKSEVIREGVRLVEEREKRLAEFNRSLAAALSDAKAGRSEPLDKVFGDLRTRFGGKPAGRAARSTVRAK